jgi:hypothetical protein
MNEIKLDMVAILKESNKFCRKSNGRCGLGYWLKDYSKIKQEMKKYSVTWVLTRGFWCSFPFVCSFFLYIQKKKIIIIIIGRKQRINIKTM